MIRAAIVAAVLVAAAPALADDAPAPQQKRVIVHKPGLPPFEAAPAAAPVEQASPELQAAGSMCDSLRDRLGDYRECINFVLDVEKLAKAGIAKPFDDAPQVRGMFAGGPLASCRQALVLCTEGRACRAQVLDLIRRGSPCELKNQERGR